MRRDQEDFEEEIRSHLAHEADQLRSEGLGVGDAQSTALRRFGNVTAAQETFYFSRRAEWWESVRADLTYAVRSIRKAKGLSAAMVLILAIGLGTTIAIYDTLESVVLHPLPFTRPRELVTIGLTNGGSPGPAGGSMSAGEFTDWKKITRSLSGIAAFRRWGYELDGASEPERVVGARTSANLFSLLGVQPTIGRLFLSAEDEPSAGRVAIISDSLWRATFSSDPTVVGRGIELNGAKYTIVGVVNERAVHPSAALWVPYVFAPYELEQRGDRSLSIVARLRPDVSIAQARSEFTQLARDEAERFPNAATGWDVAIVPLQDALIGNSRSALTILFVATCVLLLVACANVGNALLARLLTRRRELAIRAAVGASPSRLLQQLATESGVLVSLGGVGAALVAGSLLRFLGHLGPAYLPRSFAVRFGVGTLAAAVVLVLLVTAAISAMMAVSLGKLGLAGMMKSRGFGGAGSRLSLRDIFVVMQLGLALILGIDGWLLVSSLLRFQALDAGFETRRVVSATVSLPSSRYPTNASRTSYFDAASSAAGAVAGVTAVGFTSRLPFVASAAAVTTAIEPIGRVGLRQNERPHAGLVVVSPTYFDAMEIRLIAGRVFTLQDRPDGAPVMVVDELIARQLSSNGTAVGQTVRLIGGNGVDSIPRLVVGIVRSVRMTDITHPPDPIVYLPHAQAAWPSMGLVVRTSHASAGTMGEIRKAIRSIDPSRPVYNLQSLQSVLADRLGLRRMQSVLVVSFGLAAVTLALVGLYGVVAFSVRQREREFGIRLAMGASQRQVTRDVLLETVWRAAVAAVIGVVLALAGGWALSSVVVGVSRWDPVGLVAVTSILAGGALVATYLPARRASSVDPLIALRAE